MLPVARHEAERLPPPARRESRLSIRGGLHRRREQALRIALAAERASDQRARDRARHSLVAFIERDRAANVSEDVGLGLHALLGLGGEGLTGWQGEEGRDARRQVLAFGDSAQARFLLPP